MREAQYKQQSADGLYIGLAKNNLFAGTTEVVICVFHALDDFDMTYCVFFSPPLYPGYL